MRSVLISLALVGLAACGNASDRARDDQSGRAEAPRAASATVEALPRVSGQDLPDFFDCVRDAGGVLIAAHRGGPIPGFPENALETLQHGFDEGLRVFEIDIATSRDGVLFLLHDRSLGRTTTGDGPVADTDWDEISRLSLVDNDGLVSQFAPPRLSDVLNWAVASGAVLELDKKETTGWRSVIRAVDAAGAANNVILITYSSQDAALVQRLAPDLMLTASARGGRDVGRLENDGVNRRRLVGWTGTERPDPAAWRRLLNEGVEPAFGTLGRRGERLDDVYWADGNGSEYADLVEDGVVLLATDAPYRVADFLVEDDRALNACAS